MSMHTSISNSSHASPGYQINFVREEKSFMAQLCKNINDQWKETSDSADWMLNAERCSNMPEDIWPLVIVYMFRLSIAAIPPFSCCTLCHIRQANLYRGIPRRPKFTWKMNFKNAYYSPNPRSMRYNLFSSGVPGWPSRKFSGFTSPWT